METDSIKVLRELMQGNNEFVRLSESSCFDDIQDSQHPKVTMVSCCDSRVHQNMFVVDPTDHIFIIRNIGNQFFPGRGSVDFGVLKLNTPLLIIKGHVRCSAIKAAMSDYSGEESMAIRECLDGLQIPLRSVNTSLDYEAAWLRGVECNVDYQVTNAVKRYEEKIAQGELIVAGCVYDFANAYGRGRGRIVLRNINGDTDQATLEKYTVAEG